ncbi:hypothetical protein Acr_05g0001610 [Actinidia rufa]|uniref:Uncharacterized protein n=1 Tax=Actinidia rufa TaxID=165716 RepID=A0A7J0EJS1_9ERIC|nr:hypothetical protein Acr_05g0001610 [Actinidia rufa]
MTLKLGQVTTVVLSSSVLAQEALQKQDLAFSSRAIPNAIHALHQCRDSVIWLPVDHRWRCLRKILNSSLFSGARLDASSSLRRRKVEELVAYAGKCCRDGKAVDVGRAAFRTSLNVLSNTIFSVDLADPSEDTAQEFRDLVWSIMVEAGRPNLVDYFPVTATLDPQGVRRRMTAYFGRVLELFGGLIHERLAMRRQKKRAAENDALDALLNIREEDRGEIDRMCLVRPFPHSLSL